MGPRVLTTPFIFFYLGADLGTPQADVGLGSKDQKAYRQVLRMDNLAQSQG